VAKVKKPSENIDRKYPDTLVFSYVIPIRIVKHLHFIIKLGRTTVFLNPEF